MTKKNTEKTQNNLRKIGIPSSYIGITALIVYYACNIIGECQ
jgi:hypothetical protein